MISSIDSYNIPAGIYRLDRVPADESAELVQMYPHDRDQLWDVLYRTFSSQGIAFTRGIDSATIRSWLEGYAQVFVHPDADEEGITHISPRGDVHGGFSSGELRLHTDRAMIERPPAILAFTIEQAAEAGGESLFADSVAIVRQLHRKGFSLGEIAGISIVSLQSRESVPFIEKVSPQKWIVRYRDDHVAGPYSPISGLIDNLKAAIQAAAIAVPLHDGMGYLLNNTRWLHGRRKFSGRRQASRLLFTISDNHGFAEPADLGI